ncbi:hypothetical protein SK128_005961 [Halocaridina rubra]|uniref:Reelin n=1 Tax=Halocaridina rubra TaxID=373956 RepID=A0AAN8WNP2_HALRR
MWGVDNVYIGPSCAYNCGGHGYCLNGDQCFCDDNYEGETECHLHLQLSQTLVEDFENESLSTQFERWSGAEVARFCGVLTGDALVFSQQGERMLVTKDLDLSHGSVVQFYIRLSCTLDDLSGEDGPVLLHYSTDGGIYWTLLAELGRDSGHPGGLPHAKHITLSLPG